jgi:hypothetical protein
MSCFFEVTSSSGNIIAKKIGSLVEQLNADFEQRVFLGSDYEIDSSKEFQLLDEAGKTILQIKEEKHGSLAGGPFFYEYTDKAINNLTTSEEERDIVMKTTLKNGCVIYLLWEYSGEYEIYGLGKFCRDKYFELTTPVLFHDLVPPDGEKYELYLRIY